MAQRDAEKLIYLSSYHGKQPLYSQKTLIFGKIPIFKKKTLCTHTHNYILLYQNVTLQHFQRSKKMFICIALS